MTAYTLNNCHALPTKEGFLVVGYTSIDLQSRRVFGDVSDWKECPVQDFFDAYHGVLDRHQKEFFGGLCTVLDEVETPELA